ncbi:MAG: DUF1643 domain-containing protein [Porticoccaceae bacterium]|nr:DUF1643 domain-containing protein [Porticoccaceae bacterium]
MFDLYCANQRDTCRFILGKEGTRPLFIVGLNPSTANRDKSDVTATKVARVAEAEGYDGFVMTNLYPLRSTNPDNLPERGDGRLIRRNLAEIMELAGQQSEPHFWAAWGADINKRPYLTKACLQLVEEVEKLGGTWRAFGPSSTTTSPSLLTKSVGLTEPSPKALLTKAGHPRHPSRLSYAWALQSFDMQAYLAQLGGD